MENREGYALKFTFGGGIVGFVAFLFAALVPSLVYGGYAGLAIAAAILGAPVPQASLVARSLIGLGMVAGMLSVAGLFTVMGAFLGAAAYAVARRFLPSAPVAAKPVEAAASTRGDSQ